MINSPNGRMTGGNGGASTRHDRAESQTYMACLDAASVREIPISSELAAEIARQIEKLMASDSPRMRAAGTRLAISALKYNAERFVTAHGQQIMVGGEVNQRVTLRIDRGRGLDLLKDAADD